MAAPARRQWSGPRDPARAALHSRLPDCSGARQKRHWLPRETSPGGSCRWPASKRLHRLPLPAGEFPQHCQGLFVDADAARHDFCTYDNLGCIKCGGFVYINAPDGGLIHALGRGVADAIGGVRVVEAVAEGSVERGRFSARKPPGIRPAPDPPDFRGWCAAGEDHPPAANARAAPIISGPTASRSPSRMSRMGTRSPSSGLRPVNHACMTWGWSWLASI